MGRMARRVAALVGGAAVVTMVGLTASCAKEEEKAPETTTHHHDDHVACHACAAATGCADGEVDQPDRRQPVHAPGEGAASADRDPWRSLEPRQASSDVRWRVW